jgi:cyclic pyranopterin phosphate synthase
VRELSTLRTTYDEHDSALALGAGKPVDLAITTNGHLLAPMAQPLKDAGLSRITVSMDAVDPETFAAITRVPRSFERVLAGVRAAKDAGLGPVKVNCVLMRGFNDDQIERFAEFSRSEGVIVRFIEFMPLEEDRTWAPNTVIRMDEIIARCLRTQPAKRRGGSRSTTVWAKSGSLRRCRIRSAERAAGCDLRPTARFVPVCFHRAITI